MEVGLVGRGARFQALAHLLRHHDVYHWNPDGGDSEVEAPEHVREVDVTAFKDPSIVFLCLPMHRLRPVSRELGSVLDGGDVLVHTTRNLEHATLQSPSTILGEETPTQRFGFLTGPFSAEDVGAGRPATAVCASEFPEVHDLCDDVLETKRFRLYRNDDITGAESAASYARIIALLSGIARELERGKSLEATLFTRGLDETARFVVYRGGYEKTAFGLTGAGNLRLDTSVDASPEAKLGREFARREGVEPEALRGEFGVEANGLFNLIDSLATVVDKSEVDLPILEQTIELIAGRKSAEEVLEAIVSWPVYHE